MYSKLKEKVKKKRLLYYFTNIKFIKIYIVSQPFTLISLFTT